MLMLKSHPDTYRGFSLVEMLIAVAVGLVVLAGITQIFSSTVGNASDTRKMARVNADLRAAMDVMMRHIQRAGYNSAAVNPATGAVQSTSNPFTQGANDLSVGNNCITFTYDDSGDGVVDTDEDMNGRQDVHAFYLNGGAIIMRRDNSSSAVNSCSPNLTEGITDPDRVTITGLQFTLSEQCLDVTGGGTPTDCVAGAVNGNTWVKARQVTITITGKPVEDSAGTMVRSITNTVRVRNDLVCTKGSAPCP